MVAVLKISVRSEFARDNAAQNGLQMEHGMFFGAASLCRSKWCQ